METTRKSSHAAPAQSVAIGLASLAVLFGTASLAQDPVAPPAQTTSVQTTTAPAAATSPQTGMQSAFGVKGGGNLSNLYVKEVNKENGRFGYHFGLFGRIAPEHGLGFQVEALYDTKGTTIRKSYGTVDQEITYQFDYVDVPLMIVIPLGEVLELNAGGYLGYMVNSKVTSKGDLGTDTTDPRDEKFNGFDYGLLGGVAINFGAAQIGGRYNWGLQNISQNKQGAILGASKNSMAQVYLALALGK